VKITKIEKTLPPQSCMKIRIQVSFKKKKRKRNSLRNSEAFLRVKLVVHTV